MSFSSIVKEELAREIPPSRHCRIAEIAAVISMCGSVRVDVDDHVSIEIHTENVTAARKYFTLLKKTFNISNGISVRHTTSLKKNRLHTIIVSEDETARKILKACRMLRPFGDIGEDYALTDSLITQRDCCKRAFIRGAFLAAGSVSDPVRTYHYEIVCAAREKAEQLKGMMNSFDIGARVISRRRSFVVYVKDGSKIVDLLNIMGAHSALLEMENVRIVKEMRNQVNREVNCETANLNKTIAASLRQVEDIQILKASSIYSELPDALRQAAEARLAHPEASLSELGDMMDPKVGRSGINHRLKKLSSLAAGLREGHSEADSAEI